MKKIAIAALLSAFVAAPTIAADMYVGVNAGTNQTGYTDVGSSTGFGILGGYSFNESVAAELAYNSLGSANITGTNTGTLKGTVMSIAAVGSLPMGKDFSLMGKLGYASAALTYDVANNTGSGSNAGLIYGVGAQYNASKSVGVRFNYDAFTVGGGDFTETKGSTLMTIGAVFKM